MRLRVVDPGTRTLVEDLGRGGLASLGVSPSGAADRGAHRLANRLLGNDEGAATLEVLLGGLVVEAESPGVIAVAGAPVPLTVGDRAVPCEAAVYVGAGQRVRLGRPPSGLRSYVAVAGGIAAAPVLGSRSADTIAGLGPAPLAAGDVLESGAAHPADAASFGAGGAAGHDGQTAALLLANAHRTASDGEPRLTATWGPRANWFTAEARELFVRTGWEVTADGDRVGVRCAGPRLERAVDGELASEATVRGSVQVPPSGQPVIFLADHPTTGGYPVIAVLDEAATDLVAQLRPGETIRFAVRRPAYPTDLHWGQDDRSHGRTTQASVAPSP